MNPARLTSLFPSFASGILNSYTQVFFSDNRVFSWILLMVSFFDPWAGASGFISVVVANTMAYLTGLNTGKIKKGYYGFNSLLVGLGLGVYYTPGTEFLIVLFFASLLTLFLTLLFEGILGKYGLPYLSLSFLFGTWLVSLASRQFASLEVSQRGIYMTNEMFELGGREMVNSYNMLSDMDLADSVRIYFRSLGAIFFQYHLFAGIFVAAGLLIYSRISFLLSVTGFFAAYAYYSFIGADMHELSYSYIGFNFILTAIAIGGFFIIPSWWSFLWVLLLTPVISILLTSTQTVFSILQLSVYSLPFNLAVLIFLYSLKFRERFFDKPQLVSYQQFSPEKNLYAHRNYIARFGKSWYFPMILPFWGEWKVTQSHNGNFTHQGDWRHAWDFEIMDDEGLTYSGKGITREDFHAYGKPVIAPADGVIETIVEDVEENEIGKVDLDHNWGNTIVIRHADQLYTKLSHLKKGSIRVKTGDTVKKGEVIAGCGNTGRSPVPHIHFQIQSTPYIGSRTLDYPISHYIRQKQGLYELRSYDTPENNVVVSNINRNTSLEKAFHFIPGQKMRLHVKPEGSAGYDIEWEVKLDALNATYIHCERSRSMAYFRNDGDIHYFTHFEGDKRSLLFHFYLGGYKVMMGYYRNLRVNDLYPVNAFINPVAGILQDIIAPFHIFIRSEYQLRYLGMDDAIMQTNIRMQSTVNARLAGRSVKSMTCDFLIGSMGIDEMTLVEKNKTTTVRMEYIS